MHPYRHTEETPFASYAPPSVIASGKVIVCSYLLIYLFVRSFFQLLLLRDDIRPTYIGPTFVTRTIVGREVVDLRRAVI